MAEVQQESAFLFILQVDEMSFSEMGITPSKQRGRIVSLGSLVLEKLYNGKRPVTTAKKSDMLNLLPYIPSVAHDFFNKLET